MADPVADATPSAKFTAAEAAAINTYELTTSAQLAASSASNQTENPTITGRSAVYGATTMGASTQTFQQTMDNPLHDYDSYTYSLSFHLLSENQYNTLIENPTVGYVPQNVLVASAGRYGNTFRRSPFFTEDFFFDDFRMTTVVNATQRNRNANMIECNFTLIEPLGFTFINRLLDANDSIGSRNYMRQPYLLQIDFYGYANGEIQSSGPVANLSKFIPIMLTSLKSRVTQKGTEYKIQAVPYNHHAFNQTHVASPANFQVKARTVAEVLGTGQVSNVQVQTFANSARQEAEAERLQAAINAGGLAPEDLQASRDFLAKAAQGTGQFQISGYTDALNSWNQNLIQRKQIQVRNIYRVEFDAEIGNALIYPSNSPNTVATAAGGGSSTASASNATRAAGGLPVGMLDFHAGVLNIPAGTKIDQLIDYAVRNSDYIRKQLADPTSNTGNDLSQVQTKLGMPLRWYRIIPRIRMLQGQYDASREQYAYEVTYFVKPWTVNSKHPYAPQGRAPGYVKKYDYIFTGKNKDVIDLQLDFDMLYYTQMTAYRNKSRLFESGGTVGQLNLTGEKSNSKNNITDVAAGPPVVVVTDRVAKVSKSYVENDVRTETRTGGDQASAVTGGDVQRDLTLSSRGDMINIKLKILGDPQFIKQDDIFYGQNLSSSLTQLTPNGSIYTDSGELYVFVNFESPTDYNETIGLAPPGASPYQYSEFSGIYKIITVDSVFAKGQFEQTLDLVRLPIQDQLRNQITNAYARYDTYSNMGLGQLASLPFARFTGPRILVNNLGSGVPLYNAGLAGAAGAASTLIKGLALQFMSMATSQLVSRGVNAAFAGAGKAWDDAIAARDIAKGEVLIQEHLASMETVDVSSLSDAELDVLAEEWQTLPQIEFEVPTDLGNFYG